MNAVWDACPHILPCAGPRDGRGCLRAGLHCRDCPHRSERMPRCTGLGQRLTPLFEEPFRACPSIDSIKGPFERGDPLRRRSTGLPLYDEATQALHGAVERFQTGRPPSAATRFVPLPRIALTYTPNGPARSNARAFAKFSEAGVYTTTVTQPATALICSKLERSDGIRRRDEVGVGAQEIPILM